MMFIETYSKSTTIIEATKKSIGDISIVAWRKGAPLTARYASAFVWNKNFSRGPRI